MGTCSFREFDEVCIRLGLIKQISKKGELWEGLDMNGKYMRVVIHKHSGGKDIASGTFHNMVKDLGFNGEQDFYDFIRDKKRRR